jgi:EAL domain-containing protein (putative c-di-GMP-specific phosphodiesterase class I)/DNA-binding NarL/FixJ family response regulator
MASRPLERYAGMSVLVVDDNEGNVAFLGALLVALGMPRVYVETDARRVGLQLQENRPDLVLLDLHMPHIDGFAILTQIQRFAAGSYLPVLVITADTTTATRDRALVQGAQDFLTKPLDATEITLRIANLLQTRSLYATLRQANSASVRPGPSTPVARTAVRQRIQDVLDHGDMSIVYQPVVDLASLQVIGHEALSRFADPGLGGPESWFSDAFDVGLGVDLEWLAATSALGYLDSAPSDMFLALNMSPATVVHMVDNQLCDQALCARLVIELTEHDPVEDYPALHRALGEMRSLGTRLAADDVGSGYAGFRHLLRLQPDIIKLDTTLIAGIHRSPDQQALTRALVTFARDVGADVIAEGIEDDDDLVVLRDLGVPLGQGYLLGRPEVMATDGRADSHAPAGSQMWGETPGAA